MVPCILYRRLDDWASTQLVFGPVVGGLNQSCSIVPRTIIHSFIHYIGLMASHVFVHPDIMDIIVNI
jgi:hypothetical protein